MSAVNIVNELAATEGPAFVRGYPRQQLVDMLHSCAKQRGVKLLNDLPATTSRTEAAGTNRKRPAEDDALRRAVQFAFAKSPNAVQISALQIFEDIKAAEGLSFLRAYSHQQLLDMFFFCAKQRGVKLLGDLPVEAIRCPQAPSTNRKRPAEDEAVPPPSKRIRMAHNEPPVVFACRVFRQLAEDGKISDAQARACRRVVTESAANDLLLASYEYEAGVNEADVLAAINRVAPPPRPLARRVAAFVKEELKRQTLRSLAEDGKISASQARACRRVVTESPANDLLLASYEYEAGVPDADVLAVVNRVAPPARPLARQVAEFLKEEVKRQTLRRPPSGRVPEGGGQARDPPTPASGRVPEGGGQAPDPPIVCAYAFKAAVNATAVVVLNRLNKN
ncbi:hypothetical protein HDU88_001656 [Geranomyces variabilis]|nr:hypothetical protein HDU88_001656 [Geranomyces variabilis]